MSTEIVKAGGSLAVSADQKWWTAEQAAVLQSTGIDNDVTEPELRAFLHESQRTGLDPFTRQIYLIGRWDKKAGRKVFRSQTGIDGYRVIAHRAAERTGEPLSYDDALWCGEDGAWRDVWLSKEPPAAAKVTIHRGAASFSAVATWSEYVPLNRDGVPMGLWSKMPAVMTAKVAEALALRKAFPHDLAGIYTADEMEQADARAESPAQQVARASREPQRRAQRSRPKAPEVDEWSTPAVDGDPSADDVAVIAQPNAPEPIDAEVVETPAEPLELSQRAADLVASIEEADAEATLAIVAAYIKQAVDDGAVTAEERAVLLSAYEARMVALRAAGGAS